MPAAKPGWKPCAIGSNLETDLGQAAMTCLAASHSAFPVDRLACDLMAGRSAWVAPAVVLALAAGLGVGLLNGVLNNRLGIHPLILTFGMPVFLMLYALFIMEVARLV